MQKDTVDHIIFDNSVVSELHPYLSKIVFTDNKEILCVIDNMYTKLLKTYVCDKTNLRPNNIDIILEIADNWHNDGCIMPISIFFEKAGIKSNVIDISQTYYYRNIMAITGPQYKFDIDISSVRKQSIKS